MFVATNSVDVIDNKAPQKNLMTFLAVFVLFCFYLHFVIHFRKFVPPHLGKAAAAAWAALPSPTNACWVFSGFRNPPNSDVTSTIGSLTCVRYHSYACVYTRGLGTPTASQNNIFDRENISQNFIFSCAGVRTSGLWISSPTLYQLSQPVTALPWFQRVGVNHRHLINRLREDCGVN